MTAYLGIQSLANEKTSHEQTSYEFNASLHAPSLLHVSKFDLDVRLGRMGVWGILNHSQSCRHAMTAYFVIQCPESSVQQTSDEFNASLNAPSFLHVSKFDLDVGLGRMGVWGIF